jgi:hypothetical protein
MNRYYVYNFATLGEFDESAESRQYLEVCADVQVKGLVITPKLTQARIDGIIKRAQICTPGYNSATMKWHTDGWQSMPAEDGGEHQILWLEETETKTLVTQVTIVEVELDKEH